MNRPGIRSVVVLSALLTACEAQHPEPGGAGETGSIELALAAAPADASCLQVTITGSRTVSRSFPLTPGLATTFAFDKLPVGIARVEAAAHGVACAMVTPATAPAYLTESPVLARVDAQELVRVILRLVRNGRLEVTVDFETPPWISTSTAPIDLAIFGDTPYGAVQIADLPNFLASLNGDPSIVASIHLGDIKDGGSRCDSSCFQLIRDSYASLRKPFLFTPGDNEWTDCHRASNGAHDPLERLALLRALFYQLPGLSLGQTTREVLPQSATPGFAPFVENQLWVEAGATFALLHVVGSNNNLLPWFGDDTTGTKMDDPARRLAEYQARNAANLAWIDRAFATAAQYGSATVVLMMQADMWTGGASDGFNDTVQRIAQRTLAFGKPVLLIQGDSHLYKVDNPLAAGDVVHGVTTPVPNLTRLVVQGSTTRPLTEWVKLHIDAAAVPPFSWTRISR